MPSLQIRKLPQHIYEAMKSAAEQERRSISQQAIIALEKGLKVPTNFKDRRRKVLAKIQKEAQLWEHLTNEDVAAWIREDRDT